MAADGHIEGLCDLSNVVAFGHNKQWRPKAAKVASKLAKMFPICNTVQRAELVSCSSSSSIVSRRSLGAAAAAAETLRSSCRQTQRDAAAAADES